MATTDTVTSVDINPSVTAIGLNPPDTNDQYAINPDTGRHYADEGITHIQERANQLGRATGAAVLGDTFERTFHDLAEHSRSRTYLTELEQVRSSIEEEYVELKSQLMDLGHYCATTGCNRTRKFLSLWSKPCFLGADMMIFASIIKRTSGSEGLANNLIAFIGGIGLATTSVAVGTKLGRELALAHERRKRGPAPPQAPENVLPFFATAGSEDEGQAWKVLAASAAAVLLLAVALISKFAGDAAGTALGYGLLAVLTFAGSAGAEAYGTDAAGETYTALHPEIASREAKLVDFATTAGDAAAKLMTAKGTELSGAWKAHSAAGTTREIADGHRDNLVMVGVKSNGVATPLPDIPEPKAFEVPLAMPSTEAVDPPRPRQIRSVLRHRAQSLNLQADHSDPVDLREPETIQPVDFDSGPGGHSPNGNKVSV